MASGTQARRKRATLFRVYPWDDGPLVQAHLPAEASQEMGMGMYQVTLNLEMYGEWAIKMDFKKPRRDRIVKKITFGKMGMKSKHGHDAEHHQKKKMMWNLITG